MSESHYADLPSNVSLSCLREVDAESDEFDIIVNGIVAHTMQVDCTGIMGACSEEFAYAEAHQNAARWVQAHPLLCV